MFGELVLALEQGRSPWWARPTTSIKLNRSFSRSSLVVRAAIKAHAEVDAAVRKGKLRPGCQYMNKPESKLISTEAFYAAQHAF
jgi:hypothetical protein